MTNPNNGNTRVPDFFHGSDADVDSQAVKDILGGSRMDVDEAIELTQYTLSAAGQEDDGIEVDFNGSGVIVEIDTRGGAFTDAMIFKGDPFFDGLGTSQFQGKSITDITNSKDQIGIFDYDEANNYFVGNTGNAESGNFRTVVGGSSMTASEAEDLVALAESGDDPNIRYLGGDNDSAIVAVDSNNQGSTDTYFISGEDLML